MQNQVFISYRQESSEHSRAVHRLGEILRQSGLPVALDQFYLDDHPGGPNVGWPKWCEDCANQSASVLVVASAGWFAAYDKTGPPGLGLGAAAEADLIRQALWDGQGDNPRIRLVSLHEIPADQVPVRLRAVHNFRLFQADAELDNLIRWIAGRLELAGIEPPTVRWPEPIEFTPNIADRTHEEWPALIDLLAGRSSERILLYEGSSGFGKSLLVREAVRYAGRLGIPVAQVDFKGGGSDIESILGQIDLDLGAELPGFSQAGACKTHLLRKDLRTLRRPVLILFDSYEQAADNQTVADWLSQQLLVEVETALGLAVVVAGQRVPPHASAPWRDLARQIPLLPIAEVAHWALWTERRYPGIDLARHLETVVILAKGNPANVSMFCEMIAKGAT